MINIRESFRFLRYLSPYNSALKLPGNALLITPILMTLALIINVAPVRAGTIEITNNNYEDVTPQIDEGKVVWSGSTADNTRKIFLYDIASGTTMQINSPAIENYDPSNITDGKFVWTGHDGNDEEIYLYDIPTGTVTQITDNNYSDHTNIFNEISNGKIVWQASPPNPNTNRTNAEIFYYDMTTGTTTQITELGPSLDNYEPVINDGKIVWRGFRVGGNFEIFLYDIATQTTTQVSNNPDYDFLANVEDGKVTWSSMVSGGYPDNFIYDIATGITTRFTNNDYYDSDPQISNGKIVWSSNIGANNSSEIFIYDIATGTQTQITNNNYHDFQPRIKDGKIVWAGCSNDCEIYIYDLATEVTSQITYNSVLDDEPFTSDGNVIWRTVNGEDTDITLWDGVIPSNNTPTGSNVDYTENGVNLEFSQVTAGGITSVTTSSTGNQPLAGFRLGNPPTYYNISTTATFSGNVEVCINYSSLNVPGNENVLKLMHYEPGAGWVDITTSINTNANIICGITTSFSDFAVMAAPTIPDLINTTQAMNLQQGIENSLDTKLQAAQDALNAQDNGLNQTAINKLEAFINEVEAQRGKALSNNQANELHSFATNLIKIIQGETQF